MDPDGAWATVPDRREERHAVPDLDQAVPPAGPYCLGQGRTGEHEESPASPDDPVSVTVHDRAATLRGRGPDRHIHTRLGPEPGHRRGVHLGAPGVVVVEIAPRQDADP